MALSPACYVHEYVRNVKKHLKENMVIRWNLPIKAENSFAYKFEPDLHENPALEPILASHYQSQIVVLKWMGRLGIVNINTEVYMLASQSALPRERYFDAVFHIYACLKQKYNLCT